MNGAEILVKCLHELNVTHVFGYTGAAILPVFDALSKSSIKIVVNSNEQSATFSAAGHSRSSESVGVAIVTSGPAITNTLTAVADAYADSIPLIVIAGQVPEYKLGTDCFQHIDVSNVFGATAKKVLLVDGIEKIESTIKDAWFFCKAGKPGPVVIDMPINLQQNNFTYQGLALRDFSELYADECHLSDGQCETFYNLLSSSKRPLLYIGGGLNSYQGANAIRRFNKRFNIPSVNTLMGKGIIDENDANALGLLGMFGTPAANMMIQRNDFFFALGVRWDDRVAEKVGFAIHSKIAYIDINPVKVRQIRLERKPDFSAIGNAAIMLNDLADYAEKHDLTIDLSKWIMEAGELKKKWPLNYNRNTGRLQQAEVMDCLSAVLPNGAIISTGVGNHQLLAAQYLKMIEPKRFLTSGSFGTMGFGMPSAIGAYFANPNATVIVIDGDGSFRMNMGELYTIGSLGLPVKILLLNNMSDGMVRNVESVSYEGRRSATERTIDINFSEIAVKCNFQFSKRVSDRSTLKTDIQDFITANGPSMLEVMTDIEEVLYPVVPAGKGYHDMILGPYLQQM